MSKTFDERLKDYEELGKYAEESMKRYNKWEAGLSTPKRPPKAMDEGRRCCVEVYDRQTGRISLCPSPVVYVRLPNVFNRGTLDAYCERHLGITRFHHLCKEMREIISRRNEGGDSQGVS